MRRIRKGHPDAKIIMFSTSNDPALAAHAFEMGAQGFVSKTENAHALVKAVRSVAAGEKFSSHELTETIRFSDANSTHNPAKLTARELAILRLLGRGKKLCEIAPVIQVSYRTVTKTTALLRKKLGAKNHSDLIRIAVGISLGDKAECWSWRGQTLALDAV